jgi:hypothetical protein
MEVSLKLSSELSRIVKKTLEENTSRCLDDKVDRDVVYSEVLLAVHTVLYHAKG